MMREKNININEDSSCSIDEEMTATTTNSNGGGHGGGTPKWEREEEEAAATQEVTWFGVEDPYNECTFGCNTSMGMGGGGTD